MTRGISAQIADIGPRRIMTKERPSLVVSSATSAWPNAHEASVTKLLTTVSTVNNSKLKTRLASGEVEHRRLRWYSIPRRAAKLSKHVRHTTRLALRDYLSPSGVRDVEVYAVSDSAVFAALLLVLPRHWLDDI